MDNFYAFEHAFQVSERGSHLLKRVREARTLLDQVSGTFVRSGELKQLLAALSSDLRQLSDQAKTISDNVSLQEFTSGMQAQQYYHAEAIAILEDAIRQRTVLRKPEETFVKDKTMGGFSLLAAYAAIERLTNYFVRTFFGENYNSVQFCMTGLEHDFGAIPIDVLNRDVLVFLVPSVEVCRTRLWPGLAHEASHHRVILADTVRPRSQAKFQRRMDAVVRDLASQVFSRTSQRLDRELRRELILTQIGEILSDTMSVLAVGPASPFSLGTIVSPQTETDGPMNEHPPLNCRVLFLYDVLLGEARTDGYRQELQSMRREWMAASRMTRGVRSTYVQSYSRFLEEHRVELVSIALDHLIANHGNLYKEADWANANALARSHFEEVPTGTNVMAVLNAPWARRWNTFPSISQVYHQRGEHIIRLREREHKGTGHVVRLVNTLLK